MEMIDFVAEFDAAVTEGMEQEEAEEIADLFRERFGNQVTKILGAGDFGLAGSLPNDRVLKLTTDPEDVAAAAAIKAQTEGAAFRNVVDVFSACWVGNHKVVNAITQKEARIGAIVTEQLTYVGAGDTQDNSNLNRIVSATKKKFSVWPHQLSEISRSEAKRRLKRASESLSDELQSETSEALGDIANGLDELQGIGIYLVDVHSNNVGYSGEDNVYKIFDFGVSAGPKKKIKICKNPAVTVEGSNWPARSITSPKGVEVLR